MLRLRLFPLGVNGIDDSVETGTVVVENTPGGVGPSAPPLTLAVYARDFDKLDHQKTMKKELFQTSCFSLRQFASCACIFSGAFFSVALIITCFYETGTFTEIFELRHPLTKTAVVWVPHANASAVSYVADAKCELFDSRKFYGRREYAQSIVFDYSPGLPVRYLLTIILFVCWLLQWATVYYEEVYYEPFMVGNSHITSFLERSVVFPFFVVVLAVKVGISDLMTVLGLFFSAWAAMLFSFFSEILFQGDGGFLAFGPGIHHRSKSGDTVKHSGGFWAWPDGNIHYHALSMFLSLANFGFVCTGLVHNFFLTDICFNATPAMPNAVKPVKAVVYCTLALYALILLGQILTSYVKPKPSTQEILIANWKEKNMYADNQPLSPAQIEDLREVLKARVVCALRTEFFNGVLDFCVRILVFSFFFIFKRD